MMKKTIMYHRIVKRAVAGALAFALSFGLNVGFKLTGFVQAGEATPTDTTPFSYSVTGSDAYDILYTRDRYNGEKVMSVYDKASLLTNIYKNNQKLTILEILPYESASVFQMNAYPQALVDYFDTLFEDYNGVECFPFNSENVTLLSTVEMCAEDGTVLHTYRQYTTEDGSFVREVDGESTWSVPDYAVTYYCEGKNLGALDLDRAWDQTYLKIGDNYYPGGSYWISDGVVYFSWGYSYNGSSSYAGEYEEVVRKVVYGNDGNIYSVDDLTTAYVMYVGSTAYPADYYRETYEIGGNGVTAFRNFVDNEHAITLTMQTDCDGTRSYIGTEVDNYFLTQLLGELDKSNFYYQYRAYFDKNIEVISVKASELTNEYIYRDDPVDIVYIGGTIQEPKQVYRNMLLSSTEDNFYNCFTDNIDDFETGVYYKSGSSYIPITYSELMAGKTGDGTATWYNTYSRREDGTYVCNDMDWSVLKTLIKYIYGDGIKNQNSYVTHEDTGVTEYQKLPCFMEASISANYKDYNIYKLMYLLQKMTEEADTMDFTGVPVGWNPTDEGYYTYLCSYQDAYGNDIVNEDNETIYRFMYYNGFETTSAYIKSSDYFVFDEDHNPVYITTISEEDAQDWVLKTRAPYLTLYPTTLELLYKTGYYSGGTDSSGNSYNGFIDYYLAEYKSDGTRYTTSAGVNTAADKTTGNVVWSDSGKTLYDEIDVNGNISITNTTIKYGAGSQMSYYAYAVRDAAAQTNYDVTKGRGSTYAMRFSDLLDASGYIQPAGIFRYLIGLDESDFLASPDAYYEDSASINVYQTSNENVFVAYYEKDTLEGIVLDADGNLIVNYAVYDRNNKLTNLSLNYGTSALLKTPLITHAVDYEDSDMRTVTGVSTTVSSSLPDDMTIYNGGYNYIYNNSDGSCEIHFWCSIPQYNADGSENTLYTQLLSGNQKLIFTAWNHLSFENGSKKITKDLSDTAQLLFVGRKLFDLD